MDGVLLTWRPQNLATVACQVILIFFVVTFAMQFYQRRKAS